MADISQIKIGSSTYNIRDYSIRQAATPYTVLKTASTRVKTGNAVTGISTNVIKYRFFGIICAPGTHSTGDDGILSLGTWGSITVPSRWSSGQVIHTCSSFDDGNSAYLYQASLTLTATSGTANFRGGRRSFGSGGLGATEAYFHVLYGLF